MLASLIAFLAPLGLPLQASDPAALTTASAPAGKRALLVGIDRYAPGTSRAFPDLDGCKNDVRAARELLVQRFGFASEDIWVLEDERATHAAIVASFASWLIEPANERSEVLFWFSGHGSRVPDASGVKSAEIEELDNTLVAYDSRSDGRKGSLDLCDDELRSLLAALTAKGARATVILDSCHSGSAVRGHVSASEGKVRTAPAGTEPLDKQLVAGFWPSAIPLLDDDAQALDTERYVLIAACGPLQTAQEVRVEDGSAAVQPFGALSYFLAQSLESIAQEASWRLIGDQVSQRVSALYPGQSVWYEGALDRAPFDGRYRPVPEGYRARLAPDGRLLVEAGALFGLRKGSQLAVLDGWSGERVGAAQVAEVKTFASLAALAEPLRNAPTLLRAVEESRPYGLDPLPIACTDPALAEALARSDGVRIASADVLQVYRVAFEPDPHGREGAPATATWTTPDGQRIWRESESSAGEADHAARVAAIARRLEHEVRCELRYLALLRLPEIAGSLTARARFESPTASDLAKWENLGRTDARPTPRARGAARAACDEYEAIGGCSPKEGRGAILVLETDAPQPVYAHVISVAEDRSVHAIWPNDGQVDQSRISKSSGALRVPFNTFLDPDWEAGRPLRDRYIVLLAKEPIDLSNLGEAGARTTRGAADRDLDRVLQFALSGGTLRGGTLYPAQAEAFGVLEIDLLVHAAGER